MQPSRDEDLDHEPERDGRPDADAVEAPDPDCGGRCRDDGSKSVVGL
jgi:hypothetical protein